MWGTSMFTLMGKKFWRHGCPVFMCEHAAAYNLLIHEKSALLVAPQTVSPPAGCRLFGASSGHDALSGLCSGCGTSKMTSGMSKPGFDCCCFHSIISPHYYTFSRYFLLLFNLTSPLFERYLCNSLATV